MRGVRFEAIRRCDRWPMFALARRTGRGHPPPRAVTKLFGCAFEASGWGARRQIAFRHLAAILVATWRRKSAQRRLRAARQRSAITPAGKHRTSEATAHASDSHDRVSPVAIERHVFTKLVCMVYNKCFVLPA
jgi:hypothetical protein